MAKMFVNFERMCLFSALLVSVLSSDEINWTVSSTLDPRVQRLIADEKDGSCPLKDVSTFMTGCWISSSNLWQLNVTNMTIEGTVYSVCHSSEEMECGLKLCCAAYQSIRCFSTIGEHFCTEELDRMRLTFNQMLPKFCSEISMTEQKCHSIASLSESALKKAINQSVTTNGSTSQPMTDENQSVFRVIKETRDVHRLTILVRFNGSAGVVSSVLVVSVFLVISSSFV